jgi:hypothetical protein
MITARKIHKGEHFIENPAYLNPKIFTKKFYEPALDLLGANLTGFIFEQEYQRKEDRLPVVEMGMTSINSSARFPKTHAIIWNCELTFIFGIRFLRSYQNMESVKFYRTGPGYLH